MATTSITLGDHREAFIRTVTTDMTYIPMQKGFMYLTAIID